jgi:hypothetical protein
MMAIGAIARLFFATCNRDSDSASAVDMGIRDLEKKLLELLLTRCVRMLSAQPLLENQSLGYNTCFALLACV